MPGIDIGRPRRKTEPSEIYDKPTKSKSKLYAVLAIAVLFLTVAAVIIVIL